MATIESNSPGAAPVAGQQPKGNVAQYGQASVSGSQSITPAGPYVSKGTNNNIIGTVPPGKTGLPQISTVVQNPTSLLDGKNPGNGSNQADSFLNSTAGQGLIPTVNAAQLPSAGQSLAPEHE